MCISVEEGEFDEIIVQLTEDRVFVFGAPPEETDPPYGRWLANLTDTELAAVLRAMDPAVRAFIESRKLTARLVELDPLSYELWRSGFTAVTEQGGWVQATLRDHGKFARVMRIRPATGLAALAGGAAVLGAVAAQVQAAELERDIDEIRLWVGQIAAHQRDQQVGEINSAVEQVGQLVVRLRHHGRVGVEPGEIAIVANELSKSEKTCREHLRTALRTLQDVDRERSPRAAERILQESAADRVALNLHLLGGLYAATVQLGLARAALPFMEGNVHVAESYAGQTATTAGTIHSDLMAAIDRINELDQRLRDLFDPEPWDRVRTASGVGVSLAVQGLKSPAMAIGGALVPLVEYTRVMAQMQAQQNLDVRLGRLAQAAYRAREVANRVQRNLTVLQVLAEQIA